MSWHFSRAVEVAFLGVSCSDGAPSVPSSTMSTQETYSKHDKTMGASTPSLSGTMCEPSMGSRGVDWWMSSLVASRARTSARQTTKPKESREAGLACGRKWRELSLMCVPETYSLKTLHCLWEEDLPWSSVTLPKWGMMRAGVLWELITPALPTNESDAGYMPTILKTQILEKESPMECGQIQVSKSGYVQKTSKNGEPGSASWPLWMLYHGYLPTPRAAEHFMGYPMGWTDLHVSATHKCQEWLLLHTPHFKSSTMNESDNINLARCLPPAGRSSKNEAVQRADGKGIGNHEECRLDWFLDAP